MTFKPGQIIETEQLTHHGKPVVAVIGHVGDWAAYEQAYDEQDTPELIAQMGDKIWEGEARELFPELKDYRYRR